MRLSSRVGPYQSRLLALLASEGVDPEKISGKISLVQKMRRQMPIKHFQQVARATLDEKRIVINHHNHHTGEHTEREVSPQRLVHYRENWYVDAYCHTKQAIRSFAIDAIESVVMTTNPIKKLNSKKLDETLGAGYGIFRGIQKEVAVLAFSPQRAQWVSKLVWHPKQEAEWRDDGWFQVTFPYTDDREVISDILALVPDVKVISRASLREKLVALMRESIKMNA